MTRDQVKEIFKVIAFAYHSFSVSAEKIDYWHRFLNGQNPAVVMKNVEKWVNDKPFPPTIADIKEIRRNQDQSVLAGFWSDEE